MTISWKMQFIGRLTNGRKQLYFKGIVDIHIVLICTCVFICIYCTNMLHVLSHDNLTGFLINAKFVSFKRFNCFSHFSLRIQYFSSISEIK